MKKLLAILTVCALALGCFSFAAAEAELATITLLENPTTGYTWKVESSDPAVLDVIDHEYIAPSADAIGASGTHEWGFVAKSEGDAELTFTYTRDWEAPSEDDAMFKLSYHVNADLTFDKTEVEGCPEAYMPEDAVISLEENPSTGYEWSYTADVEDVLGLAHDEYIPYQDPNAELQAAGSGGVHTWIFYGAHEGDVTLTFTYAQPWEGGGKGDTLTYTYHIGSNLYPEITGVGGNVGDYEAAALPVTDGDEASANAAELGGMAIPEESAAENEIISGN